MQKKGYLNFIKKNNMFNIKKFFSRLIIKYKIYEKNLFKEKQQLTGYENICSSIVRKTINHKDTKFTIAPLSDKRYLINKPKISSKHISIYRGNKIKKEKNNDIIYNLIKYDI